MEDIHACLFDLDGVIVDTAKYHYLAWKRLAETLNFDFSLENNEKLKGVSRMESLDILLKIGGLNFDEEKKLQMAAQKNQWYVEYISSMTEDELLPGVKSFIFSVRDKGIKTAIGSVSKNTMTILKRINMCQYFDAIIDGNKIAHAKPNPEVFLKGAEALGVNPSNCVVFEDAEAGIQAAINAGMHSIGVGSPSVLGKADFVISSFDEITVDRLNFNNKG